MLLFGNAGAYQKAAHGVHRNGHAFLVVGDQGAVEAVHAHHSAAAGNQERKAAEVVDVSMGNQDALDILDPHVFAELGAQVLKTLFEVPVRFAEAAGRIDQGQGARTLQQVN